MNKIVLPTSSSCNTKVCFISNSHTTKIFADRKGEIVIKILPFQKILQTCVLQMEMGGLVKLYHSKLQYCKDFFAKRNGGLVNKIVPLQILILQRFLQTEKRKIVNKIIPFQFLDTTKGFFADRSGVLVNKIVPLPGHL